MELDTVVRSAVISDGETALPTDIGIKDGRIAALGPRLEAREVLDVGGLTVVPGPIDVHTHFENTVGGVPTLDDYESGSRAAALGGVTTYINYAFQNPGQKLTAVVQAEREKADGRSHLDFGLHVVVTDPSAVDFIRELPELAEQGVTSLKVFMAGDGLELSRRSLLVVLGAAAAAGFVVNVHAEDGPIVDHCSAGLRTGGHRSTRHLPRARPPEAEGAAIGLIGWYSSLVGCTVYIVHLSSARALDAVRGARASGANMYSETRPAYLFLNSDRYELPEREANEYVCWPPLRPAEDQLALWEAIRAGEIHTYATDHATWEPEHKSGVSTGFDQVAPGMSSIQTSVGLLYSEGVRRDRLSLRQFVALTSRNPAKLFGLWPRKGTLMVGSDADLLVLDPDQKFTIVANQMASKASFDPFSGWTLAGWPVLSILRGRVIMKGGELQQDQPIGQFQRRGRLQPV